MLILLVPLLTAAAPGARLEVSVLGLRSTKGQVRLCLTRARNHFPNCAGDPAARKLSVAATAANSIVLNGVEPGSWALSVIHDENGNGKLDTTAKIPREGFGFSRNPAIRFGAPKFDKVRFDIADGAVRQSVMIKYFL